MFPQYSKSVDSFKIKLFNSDGGEPLKILTTDRKKLTKKNYEAGDIYKLIPVKGNSSQIVQQMLQSDFPKLYHYLNFLR